MCSLLTPAKHHPDLFLCRNKLIDVSAVLQPLLHGNEQFNPVYHQLYQTHLAHTEGRHVAHMVQRRGLWELRRQVQLYIYLFVHILYSKPNISNHKLASRGFTLTFVQTNT